MRTEQEIINYGNEAFDKVWLVRKQNMPKRSITDDTKKAIQVICDKYNIDFNKPIDDWDYGFYSGILAALRWTLGDEKDFLDT